MRSAVRAACAFALYGLAFVAIDGLTAEARSETRTLSFKQLHTGETVTITFKRNGRYDSEGLKKINYILRDWRRNESTTMDPALLDLVWEVRNAVGSKAPIYVLSGYRSPVTNAMLRSRSRGVAKTSQHMVGKAMDFYLPDVPLTKLRETALKFQGGGVGYYPTSGSPFVHMDTGSVRHWPRMTRQQLAKLFPDGKTLHIPSDGKPMPGYNQAVASVQSGTRSRTASASSSTSRSRQVAVASYPRLDPSVAITPAAVARSTGGSSSGGRSLIAALFESGEDGDEEGASNAQAKAAPTPAAEVAPAPAPEPQAPTVVASLANTPVPRTKPLADVPAVAALPDAPIPTPKPVLVAMAEPASESAATGTPLMTASVSPQALVTQMPRARPLMTGTDAIGMLIARGGDDAAVPAQTAVSPAPLEPENELTTATALAATGPHAEMPPFAATFTGSEIPVRDRPVLVAIDYRAHALLPYLGGDNSLRGHKFVVLRHPDQTDLGALTAVSGPVVVNRFAAGPQLIYPMRRFTGPAVSPVETRTYEFASLADNMTTGSVSDRQAERAAALR
ncbi:DUF882 domain-containing protein [Microbaculum sp. FT89]|uniref:DUF882 domain-containing protein n=1 Tax=Microbaculum sp. FT89 TaxID=3447298 RepID=UPI003F53521F